MRDNRTHNGPSFGPSQLPQHPTIQFSPSVYPQTHATDLRSLDGLSCTIVQVVRDHVAKGVLVFLCVLQRTSTMDRHTLGDPSYITAMTVRDPSPKGLHTFSKYPLIDTYDGPSPCITIMTVRDHFTKGIYTFL